MLSASALCTDLSLRNLRMSRIFRMLMDIHENKNMTGNVALGDVSSAARVRALHLRRLKPVNRYGIKFSLSNRVIYFPLRHIRDPLTLEGERESSFSIPSYVLRILPSSSLRVLSLKNLECTLEYEEEARSGKRAIAFPT